jgi:hypothetical protein
MDKRLATEKVNCGAVGFRPTTRTSAEVGISTAVFRLKKTLDAVPRTL